VSYGSALASEVFENRLIVIPGLRGRDPKEISEKNLALIIQARAEEILDHVMWEVRRAGFDGQELIGGIVLTGGGALMRDIDKLTELHTGMPARVGTPIEHLAHGYQEKLTSPIYATGVGLLLQGFADIDAGKVNPAVARKKAKQEAVKAQAVKAKEEAARTQEQAEEQEAVAAGPGWFDNAFKKTKEWFEAEPDSDF
jgi:cell division protein FtsA